MLVRIPRFCWIKDLATSGAPRRSGRDDGSESDARLSVCFAMSWSRIVECLPPCALVVDAARPCCEGHATGFEAPPFHCPTPALRQAAWDGAEAGTPQGFSIRGDAYRELLGDEWLRAFAFRGSVEDLYRDVRVLIRELGDPPENRVFDPIELLEGIKASCTDLQRALRKAEKQ
jgi:hypothetical protein